MADKPTRSPSSRGAPSESGRRRSPERGLEVRTRGGSAVALQPVPVAIGSAAGAARPPFPGQRPTRADESREGGLSAGARRYPRLSVRCFAVAIGSAAGAARPPFPGQRPTRADESREGGLSAAARRYPRLSARCFAVAIGSAAGAARPPFPGQRPTEPMSPGKGGSPREPAATRGGLCRAPAACREPSVLAAVVPPRTRPTGVPRDDKSGYHEPSSPGGSRA